MHIFFGEYKIHTIVWKIKVNIRWKYGGLKKSNKGSDELRHRIEASEPGTNRKHYNTTKNYYKKEKKSF